MDSLTKKPITVLVVEDHDDSRRMMQILLELDGFRVFSASTGRQALDLSASKQPDIVLMDVNLPDQDGLSVTQQLRRQSENNRTPIIALTAYDTNESRDRALAAGCNEFMLKPVNFERLEALICRLLAGNRETDPSREHGVGSGGSRFSSTGGSPRGTNLSSFGHATHQNRRGGDPHHQRH